MYIHIYIYTNTYIYIHIYVYVLFIYIYIDTYIYDYLYLDTYKYVYAHLHMYIYIHIYMWILTVSWAELKLQDGLQRFAWRRCCCTIARACLRGCMCILRWVWHVLSSCLEHQCMCRYVDYIDALWHQFTYLQTHPPQPGCVPTLVYA